MAKGGRSGKKSRLYMSAKRKKRHLQVKRKMHWESQDRTLTSHVDRILSPIAIEENINSSPLTVSSPENLEIEPEPFIEAENTDLEGRRIVNIKFLFTAISKVRHDHTGCTFVDLAFIHERRHGLHSEFVFECKMCKKRETIHSEDPNTKIPINTAIVEGTICTGNGYSQLNEICASINMPSMNKNTYAKIEQSLAPTIEECALEEMIAAGQEEKRLAVLSGNVDELGSPLVTVVADGSWAKRSYKSGFSSASGAACIVGLRTKKVLFLGVRNSYCCICAKSQKLKTQVPEHRCFKNWQDSANAMEADIIAEGFAQSMNMHGIKYKRLVGDGDSSIMKKLMLKKPYGHNFQITKIECKNHLLRNFCNKIKSLAKKTNNNKGFVPVNLRKKVESSVLRLRKAVVGAINHRKEEENLCHNDKIKKLKMDIKNAANHVFGDHSKCASYFCIPEKHANEVNNVKEFQDCGLWTDIQHYLLSLATNAESLILDVTNNSVEQFNNVIAKFIGGKRVNFTKRGSYQTRCFGAVTSWNSKTAIHSKIHEKLQEKGQSPGKYIKLYTERIQHTRTATELTRKRKSVYYEERGHKRYKTTGPDENYGRQELEEDIPPEMYELKKKEFLKELESNKNINILTIGQSDNQVWAVERRKRLTASNFGRICKLRPKTSVRSILENLLYSEFKGTAATNYGKEHEAEAIQQFAKETGLQVVQCGLFVDSKKPFLAASPDGLIGHDSLIEVKCPYKIMDMTPEKGIKEKKVDFCTYEANKLELKRNHNYYYQVQGQLHVTGREWCYFIVWSPKGLLYQKIKKDDAFWEKMEPLLEKFYDQCLLPEILDGRIPKKRAVRERT